MDSNKIMVIVFPDGDANTAQKMQLIAAYLAGEADIILHEPGEDERDDFDGIDPANIRFRFASDEDK